MARKKKLKANKGDILFLELGEIEKPVLGKLYEYQGLKVRVVHRGDKIKVIVE